ncbi:glycosyltransferase family 8 protein [Bacillus sp. 1P02SD]|uniref:glycosyltransferase family 8 protein n=1 Tax=Bacillus sp. 1P02SD TaxID=3132264 RepID=UPI0039A104F5
MNVVYSTDDNYAQHVGVSLISLFENNLEFEQITVFLIENNITNINKKKLKSICIRYNRAIHFINFNIILNQLKLNINNSISINAYARLFLSSFIDSNINKILYLDCDSIINDSLSDLWKYNIKNYYVAGVADTVSDLTKFSINMSTENIYINSGVLLINLKKWRENNIEQKFIKFISDRQGNVFHHDQGVLNGTLKEKILVLPPKYNAMTIFFTMNRNEIFIYYGMKEYCYNVSELKEAKDKPVIIHFTPAFVNRPWIKGCKHPFNYLYQKYLKMSPWKETQLLKDQRKLGEKIVAFMFNYFPFKVANNITNFIFK